MKKDNQEINVIPENSQNKNVFLIPPYSVWVIRMYIHIMNIQKDN